MRLHAQRISALCFEVIESSNRRIIGDYRMTLQDMKTAICDRARKRGIYGDREAQAFLAWFYWSQRKQGGR